MRTYEKLGREFDALVAGLDRIKASKHCKPALWATGIFLLLMIVFQQ